METFPIRINKYVAQKGFSTRRGADELIAAGKVLLNGKKAKLGDQVHEGDSVTLADFSQKKYVYYAYYKPAGIITVGKEPGTKSIADVIKFPEKVFPLGRLDKESEGLIIMTNDGRLSDKLLNPASEHEKEYQVVVDRPITHEFLVKMSQRVDIGIGRTKKSKIRRVDKKTFDIILSEGKNRQIRRMCGVLGYGVKELTRFRIMNVLLGKLKPNQYRNLTPKELKKLLVDLGIA